METSAFTTFPKDYGANDQDGRQYTRHCLLGAAVLGVGYGLAIAHLIPLVVLPLVVALVLPRWMINFHELLHLYPENQINPWIRLMGVGPLPLSVISLSYREIRTLHFGHHGAPGTDSDPDAYHIRGHWSVVIFNAFTAPEQSTLRWLIARGITVQLGIDLTLKLLIFIGLMALGGGPFLWLWLSMRLVYGLGDLAFFRMVHYRQGNCGTFGLTLPPPLLTFSEIAVGKTVVHTTINHDIHHRYPHIAARCLMAARSQMVKPADVSDLSSSAKVHA